MRQVYRSGQTKFAMQHAIIEHKKHIAEGGNCMEVTDVRVRRLTREGKMRAIVSITLEDKFVIHDVRVIDGSNGLFVAMPSKRSPNGEFRDIAHPISAEAREIVQQAVIGAYEEAVEKTAVNV